MDKAKLMDVHILARRMYRLLSEVDDLSRQLAEAVDRNDQVSAEMLMSMREAPIRQLVNTKEDILRQLDTASAEDARRLRQLLNGEEPREEEEKGLAAQAASNTKLLRQVQALDEVLNRKITRDDSIYAK